MQFFRGASVERARPNRFRCVQQQANSQCQIDAIRKINTISDVLYCCRTRVVMAQCSHSAFWPIGFAKVCEYNYMSTVVFEIVSVVECCCLYSVERCKCEQELAPSLSGTPEPKRGCHSQLQG